ARNTLLSWTKKGLLVQVVGGVKRINTADIDDYMNNHGK
ncbi:DNA-binding protein, partial [Lacticaseibacillus rhamnosus]